MAINEKKLRGRIIELYGSQNEFAKVLGITNISVSRKMTGNVGFSAKDIAQWCELLKITSEEVGAYFFSEKV